MSDPLILTAREKQDRDNRREAVMKALLIEREFLLELVIEDLHERGSFDIADEFLRGKTDDQIASLYDRLGCAEMSQDEMNDEAGRAFGRQR